MLLSTIYTELLLPIPTDCPALDVSKGANAALIYASKRRDLPIIERLLLIPTVKKSVSEDSKMLELAASMGDLILIKRLLLIPAVLENVTANMNGALREAAGNGHLEVVEYLLTIPTVLNVYKKGGTGSLQSACENGHLPVVECLLSADYVIGADAYIYLKAAAAGGHLNVVKYLLLIPVVLENAAANMNGALREAACNGHLDVVKHLLTIPTVLNVYKMGGNGSLQSACENGHLPVVECLLSASYFIGDGAYICLTSAAAGGHLNVVKRLLLIPVVLESLAIHWNRAFVMAACNGHLDVVKHLLTIPAVLENVTANTNEALRKAAYNGHLEVVKHLLTIPKVLNSFKEEKTGSLESACENGHLSVVRCLLSAGRVIGDDAFIYLAAASAGGHLDVVKHLLTIPVFLENAAANTNEALREAICNGHLDVVKHLLKVQAVQDAIPLDTDFLVKIIQKRQIKIIVLLLRSPKFWGESLLCLKKETGLTLKDKEILKTCLQVALLKKIAEFKIYPDDKDFVKKAKMHSSRISDKAFPNKVLEEITQFTSSLRYFCPLPPKVALAVYPKILEYLGFDLPNKALKYREEYYLDPSFKHVPILRAYQAIDRLRNSRLSLNLSKPLSLPSASASSVCASLQTDAMDIDTASSVVLNIEDSKKRKRTTPEKRFNTSAAASMIPENEIALGAAEPILREERKPKRVQFQNK